MKLPWSNPIGKDSSDFDIAPGKAPSADARSPSTDIRRLQADEKVIFTPLR